MTDRINLDPSTLGDHDDPQEYRAHAQRLFDLAFPDDDLVVLVNGDDCLPDRLIPGEVAEILDRAWDDWCNGT